MAPVAREPGQGINWSNIAVGALLVSLTMYLLIVKLYGRWGHEYGTL